jgi:hypothetical protein
VDITRGYGALDQYAMGLRAPEEVPPFFYVEDGVGARSTAPPSGVPARRGRDGPCNRSAAKRPRQD